VIPPLIQVAIGTIDTVTKLLVSFPGETFDFTWQARSEMVHLMLRDAAYGHNCLWLALQPSFAVRRRYTTVVGHVLCSGPLGCTRKDTE
jgi:hypothetical protein